MMRTGNWGLAAVSPQRPAAPARSGSGHDRDTHVPDAGGCDDLPRNLFGSVTLPEIEADKDAKADMSLARNMSQVYVRILDKDNIVNASKPITVQLTEVPSTVSWAGEHPAGQDEAGAARGAIVLTIPATETWTDSLSTDNKPLFKMSSMGHHTIIPAHRGTISGTQTAR